MTKSTMVKTGMNPGDVPTYDGADFAPSPLITNLVANGAFEAGIAGWGMQSGDETLEHATDAQITGDGSLHIVTPANGAGRGAQYGGVTGIAVEDNALLVFGMNAKGTGTIRIRAGWENAAFSGSTIVQITLTGSPQFWGGLCFVPPGAAHLWLDIQTWPTSQVADFYIDDVSLVQFLVAQT